MDIKVLGQKEVPVLSRKVITADLTFTGATPSNDQVRDKLSGSLKANKNLLVIKKISTVYGHQKALVEAYLYQDEGKLKAVEPKLHKKQLEKMKKQEEARKKAAEEAAKAKEAPKE